jgi:hypothetical protein
MRGSYLKREIPTPIFLQLYALFVPIIISAFVLMRGMSTANAVVKMSIYISTVESDYGLIGWDTRLKSRGPSTRKLLMLPGLLVRWEIARIGSIALWFLAKPNWFSN